LPVTLRRSLVVRLASERMIPIVAALVVLGASMVSLQPAAAQPIGQVSAGGTDVRLAVGGGGDAADQPDPFEVAGLFGGPRVAAAGADEAPAESYADDGTIYKPVAVNTIVHDGKGLLQTYTVQTGDTLTGIASRYGLSMMTVWWANKLSSKDDLHVGQKLTIPPVNGLVVMVKDGDTLDSLAASNKVDAGDIVAVNQLDDPTLVIGQTLILPDAVGAPIPTPKPTPRAKSSGGGGGSCNCSGPSSYGGGAFLWPVVGGNNYISQYFHYGHYAVDIAATYGSTARAAAAGRVIFAGWKNNGGGYQVWISHGSNLYTTYNHMSAITVGTGQSVSTGTQVGRVGQSGHATGPHLHFEVWIGSVWNGGYRVNPLRYF
jgi:murein DD-endopeptidase MepM/ murein hydrolase activator NlpD